MSEWLAVSRRSWHTALTQILAVINSEYMRFQVDIRESDVPLLVEQLLHIVGVEPWSKRFEWLAREVDENRHMAEWLRARCNIEWELGAAIANGDLLKPELFRIHNLGRYELAGFCAGLVQIYSGLSAVGQNRLRGTLLDGLKSDKGLLSLQHEIATAVHLVRAGFNVDFHDFESGGGYDFLAKNDGIELEVECKMFSADIGRKIHRRLSSKLFNVLEPVINQIFRGVSKGLVIRIALPDRLTPAPTQHNGIRRAVELGVLAGGVYKSEYCDVSVVDFNIANSPFSATEIMQIDHKAAKEYIGGLTGNSNSTLMIMVSPGERVVVAMLESKQPDSVLKGIRRQLRDGAVDQFSQTRPACLVAQLHDLTNAQLYDLASSDSPLRYGAHGLQIMTSDLLQSESRAHVHSVVYRGRATFATEDGAVGSPSWAYVMKNARHPLANDLRYSPFSPGPQTATRIHLGE